MSLHLTARQRLKFLRYVADDCAAGVIPDTAPQRLVGVDVGYALLTLACEGLCEVEEPNYVCLTPEGEKMLERA